MGWREHQAVVWVGLAAPAQTEAGPQPGMLPPGPGEAGGWCGLTGHPSGVATSWLASHTVTRYWTALSQLPESAQPWWAVSSAGLPAPRWPVLIPCQHLSHGLWRSPCPLWPGCPTASVLSWACAVRHSARAWAAVHRAPGDSGSSSSSSSEVVATSGPGAPGREEAWEVHEQTS